MITWVDIIVLFGCFVCMCLVVDIKKFSILFVFILYLFCIYKAFSIFFNILS